MAVVPFEEGKLWGEDRDPTLKWENLRGLDDERLGKLLRALGRAAAVFQEAERSANCPSINLMDLDKEKTEEEREAEDQRREKSQMHISRVNGFIAKAITGVIAYSDIDPNAMVMQNKSAIFKNGEPVLYLENWQTGDLHEPDRKFVELQMFVGLNDHLQTDAGKKLAHNALGAVLGGSFLSFSGVPSAAMGTLGTVPEEVFAPFARETERSQAQ